MFKLCFGKGKGCCKKEYNTKKKTDIKPEENKTQIEYFLFVNTLSNYVIIYHLHEKE